MCVRTPESLGDPLGSLGAYKRRGLCTQSLNW